jgi:hypothetical protein
MRKLIFTIIGTAMTFLTMSQTARPELICSAGDSYSNSSYLMDWSIGELSIETYTSSTMIISQGFHQGEYVVTRIDEIPFFDFSITAFPNPTSDLICLKVESTKVEHINYAVSDISGKVLLNGNTANQLEQINFSNYAPGVYFMSVTQNNKLLKSFKIIKK